MSDRKPTILHVDDDEANRYAVTRSLVKAGFDVTEASDGAGALAAAAAGRPDLIILDVQLPDMDGFEVCRRMKAHPQTADIPVLHLSASFVTGGDKAYGLDGGAEAYLVRPVEPVELVATVRALLRAKASEDALRAEQERLGLILSNIKDHAIFTLALDGTVTDWNVGAERVFGWAADEIVGHSAAVVFTPEDQAGDRPAIEMRLSAERGMAEDTRYHLRKDGTRFFASGSMEGLRDAAGHLRGFVKVVRDITERRRAEEERHALLQSERAARALAEASAAEAERAGRMKDEFLATLSHELRTPLNAILGWAGIIRGGGGRDAEDVTEGIEVIERNARAQSQIIEDLLDMSRIISGKVSLETGPVDLTAVVAAAVATARPTADARGVALASTGPAAVVVPGDAGRLQQVLWNLLSNAVKFTPRGGRVGVAVERAGGTVTVAVTDTGDGIGADFLPFVFDRFRQADATTTRRHGGLGLGLSIVKQLVELHGGSVAAASPGAGRGTTVTVALPLVAPAAVADAAPPVAADRPAAPAAGDVTGLRVLVVDDEPDARGLAARLLRDAGAVVTAAGSADEAVDLLGGSTFDVLVSDIAMPGEDGYSLLRRVRALPRGGTVPAVALTAYARPQDRAATVAAGFAAHVPKPVDAARLLAAVAGLKTPPG